MTESVTRMLADDVASRALGIEVRDVSAGAATATMTIRADMVNGHGITHGAFVFAVADTAFACACNSHGPLTVAAAVDITFVAPSRAGDVLEARAVERTRFGRSGIYDVTVRRGDDVIAEFRGTSRTIGRDRGVSRLGAAPPAELLDAGERLSRDALLDLQLERLRWSLRHAYTNVPHYRARVRRRGRHARRLRDACRPRAISLHHQARSPRQLSRSACSPCRGTDVRRIHASSGTTGRPTVVGYTQDDLDTWADLMARSIRAAGGRPGDIVHVAYGYGLFTGGLGAHYGAERLGCTVVPVSGGMTPRQVQLIRDFEPVDHHGHAVVHARAASTSSSVRASTRGQLAAHRHLRRGAVDRGDACRDRGRVWTCTRWTSTDCPR